MSLHICDCSVYNIRSNYYQFKNLVKKQNCLVIKHVNHSEIERYTSRTLLC